MLDKLSLDTDVDKILARLDRTSPEALLKSIAQELLRLHQAFDMLAARMHALEITQTTYDQMVTSSETIAFAPLPRTALIDASFSLSTESGFYPLEYDNLGVPYRWTGPNRLFSSRSSSTGRSRQPSECTTAKAALTKRVSRFAAMLMGVKLLRRLLRLTANLKCVV